MKSLGFFSSDLQSTLAAIGFSLLGFSVSQGQTIDLTSSATPIMGLIASGDYTKTGLAYSHDSSLSKVTDGTTGAPDLTTWSDTFNTGVGTYDSSYVGFTFDTPPTSAISGLTVTFLFIIDGGWYGKSTRDNPLTEDDLWVPTLQTTMDGSTWSDVLCTTDYKARLTGQPVGITSNVYPTAKVTFTPKSPILGAKGIRIVGLHGGTGSFIAVADERVFAGDPPTAAVPPKF